MSTDAQYDPDHGNFPAPRLFITWKNTDLCGNFHCKCGAEYHIDSFGVYAIKCGECGAEFRTPHTVALKEIPAGSEPCTYYTNDKDDPEYKGE